MFHGGKHGVYYSRSRELKVIVDNKIIHAKYPVFSSATPCDPVVKLSPVK